MPRRRAAIVVGLIAAGAVVGAIAVTSDTPDTDPTGGDNLELLAITRTPDAYRMVVRVDDVGAGEPVSTTDEVLVRRPFEARRERRAGPPPGGDALSLEVQTFGRHATTSGDDAGEGAAGTVVLAAEPSPPAVDLRPAAAIEEAVSRGLLEPRRRRRVAGRTCQVFRARGAVPAGALPAGTPAAGEWTDLCIDEAGLVLAEEWATGGSVVRRRTAVAVDESPTIPTDAFLVEGDPVPVVAGGGAVQRVTDESRPPAADFWELEPPPASGRMPSPAFANDHSLQRPNQSDCATR